MSQQMFTRNSWNGLLFYLLLLFKVSNQIVSEAKCGTPGSSSGCMHNGSKDKYWPLERVNYFCKSSECLVLDTLHRECLTNGSWSGNVPVCYKSMHLQNIEQSSTYRGDILWTTDKNLSTCSKTQFTFRPYWQAKFSKSSVIIGVKLTFPGNTTGNINVIVKNENRTEHLCANYDLKNRLPVATSVTIMCRSGTIGKSLQILKIGDGSASRDMLEICEVLIFTLPDCLSPDIPLHGNGHKTQQSGRTLFTFTCDFGYKLLGNREIICQSDGNWFPMSPICVKITNCKTLPKIQNGNLSTKSTLINSVADLTCDEGYAPFGNFKTRCLPNGEWLNPMMLCTIVQCDPQPTLHHGSAKLLDNSSVYGTKLLIECYDGYVASSTNLRTCNQNGSWGNLDICVSKQCGSVPTNATIGGKWKELGGKSQILVLICDNAYHIVGSPAVIQCLPNGSWSLTNAECIENKNDNALRNDWPSNVIIFSAVGVGITSAFIFLCAGIMCWSNIRKRIFLKSTNMHRYPIFPENTHNDPYYHDRTIGQMIDLQTVKPPSSLPCSSMLDEEPLYAQPFESDESYRDVYPSDLEMSVTHIYAEPIDTQRTVNGSSIVGKDEICFQNGICKFRSTSDASDQQTASNPCESYANSNSSINSCKKQEHKTELTNNSIYSRIRKTENSKTMTKLDMICNNIYENHTSNV